MRARSCSVRSPLAWTPPDRHRVLPRHVDQQWGKGEVCPPSAKTVPEPQIIGEIQAFEPWLPLQTENRTHLAPLMQYPG